LQWPRNLRQLVHRVVRSRLGLIAEHGIGGNDTERVPLGASKVWRAIVERIWSGNSGIFSR